MTNIKLSIFSLIVCVLALGSNALARASSDLQECLEDLFHNAEADMLLHEIRARCSTDKEVNNRAKHNKNESHTKVDITPGIISTRIIQERRLQPKAFVLTPHRINYLLPVYTTNDINQKIAQGISDIGQEDLENVESKFQLSLRVPLNTDSLFINGDGLYLAFTMQAWWQVYSSGISKPFRESNYKPEVFYLSPLAWQPFNGNTAFIVGLEHQSNGRSQSLSRSWNRVYANLLYEKANFAFSFKPWLRLSAPESRFPLDPDGDDNPDIQDYMGNFELGAAYQWKSYEATFLGRQNFSTGKGSLEFGFSFPLFGKLNAYAVAFSGYGDSLIDYNHHQTRFGIGISLNHAL